MTRVKWLPIVDREDTRVKRRKPGHARAFECVGRSLTLLSEDSGFGRWRPDKLDRPDRDRERTVVFSETTVKHKRLGFG